MARDAPITRLLQLTRQGDAAARETLMENIYQDLHRIAQQYARRERIGHTLQATALVNEVYLKLLGKTDVDYESRAHFFAVSATQMRCVLVDYARRRRASRRGGQSVHFSLEDFDGASEIDVDELLEVDLMLEQLREHDARLAQLVELKYFAGMTDQEIAGELGLSFAQVRRDWEFARAWLRRKLENR